MPEWMTPLLRVLVAMPTRGFCSTRKTSGYFSERACAMAQPITPPPMIRTWACSIALFILAQHAAPLQRCSFNGTTLPSGARRGGLRPYKGLLHDDAEEFLFADAHYEFGFFVEIDAGSWIGHDFAVDFEGFLLDEALGFGGGGYVAGEGEELGPSFFAERRDFVGLRELDDSAAHLRENDKAVAETAHLQFLDLLGGLAVAEDALEVVGGAFGGFGAVEGGDDFFGELHFGVHGMERAGGDCAFQLGDFVGSAIGDQVVVGPHEIVGDGHEFAEDVGGRLGDADVVAEALGHFALAIEPEGEGLGGGDLGGPPVFALDVAVDEEIEFLLGGADFDVG